MINIWVWSCRRTLSYLCCFVLLLSFGHRKLNTVDTWQISVSVPAVRRWRRRWWWWWWWWCELFYWGGTSFLLLVFTVESQDDLSARQSCLGSLGSGSTDDVISRYKVCACGRADTKASGLECSFSGSTSASPVGPSLLWTPSCWLSSLLSSPVQTKVELVVRFQINCSTNLFW